IVTHGVVLATIARWWRELPTVSRAGPRASPGHQVKSHVEPLNAGPHDSTAWGIEGAHHEQAKSSTDGAGVAELTVTEVENGGRWKVGVGDMIVVCLRELAGTGYRWTVASLDQTCIRLVEQSYQSMSTAIGGTGVAVWRLETIRPGHTRVQLKKSRL